MKFEDVVHNGVLQAFGLAPRHKRGRLTPPDRAQRLVEYKGARIERSLIGWMKQGHMPQIIWD